MPTVKLGDNARSTVGRERAPAGTSGRTEIQRRYAMPKEPCRRNSALPGGMKEAACFRETTCAVAASCVFF